MRAASRIRRGTRFVLGAAALALALVSATAGARVVRLVAFGVAYKAKTLCSGVFVSGLEPNAALADIESGNLAVLRHVNQSIGLLAASPRACSASSGTSGTTNVMTRLIRRALGDDGEYAAFPRRALFDRIGIASATLEADASGTFVGSSFVYASARDWARFGRCTSRTACGRESASCRRDG